MDTNYSKICPRRGTATLWAQYNPVLAEGEIGVELPDSGSGQVKIKFGDGSTQWNDLQYAINPTVAHAIYGGTPESSNDIFIRRGTYTEWIAEDPILGDGEIVYDKTHNSLILGDGAHKFSELTCIRASSLISSDEYPELIIGN